MDAALNTALRRHRAVTLGALVILTALAWAWLILGAGMGGVMAPLASLPPGTASSPEMPGMVMDDTMAMASSWPPTRFALTFSMWWIMMIAMMLPSAAPMILLYARASTQGDNARPPATAAFLFGYLIAWGLFSLIATLLHRLLDKSALLSTMAMASQSRVLSGVIVLLAGFYQLSPVKDMCLRLCRSPAQFLSRHYQAGRPGALRMGLRHGAYCVGCCWLLMALLFIGGVMNLAWIALLTLIVASEKMLPFGRTLSIVLGLGCIAWGSVLLLG